MSANIINQVAYLRTTREIPEEIHQLTVELNKMYVDIAAAVNTRTIGLYPVNRPAQTGNSFFITNNQKQATLRQIYKVTSTASIDHNLKTVTAGQFINCYGSYTDSPTSNNTFGLIFGSDTAIVGQTSFYVTPTQIVFKVGAGAPVLSSGIVVLEWVSQV